MALLSVGKGIPGIPSHEALKRYDAFSIPVLRTDRDGMIRIWRNKDGIVYSTQEK
jgi:beta-lactamase superfamily II metal-dependent hydrolase